jgi:thiamine-phosphate pyrophosphorylase
MQGLYAIVDVETLSARSIDPVAFAEAVLTVRPAALQLRAKDACAREALSLLRAMAPMCRAAGVPLVANDRPDFAILAGCPMVHVGQTDMPIDRVRRIVPGVGVGVSTHDLAQLDAALEARPAYVAFGPVFETSSKKNPDPVVGAAALREAYARAVAAGVPLVAIGGITRQRAVALVGMADAVAVIGELVPPRAPAPGEEPSTAQLLLEVVERARFLQSLFARPAASCAS